MPKPKRLVPAVKSDPGLADYIIEVSEKFSEWLDSKRAQEQFQALLDKVAKLDQHAPTRALVRKLTNMSRVDRATLAFLLGEAIGDSSFRSLLTRQWDAREKLYREAIKHLSSAASSVARLADWDRESANVVFLFANAEKESRLAEQVAAVKLDMAEKLRKWKEAIERERAASRAGFSTRRFGTSVGAGSKLINSECLDRLRLKFPFSPAELARLVTAAYSAWKRQEVDLDSDSLRADLRRFRKRVPGFLSRQETT